MFVHPPSCSASASGLTTNLVPYSPWVSEFLLDGSRLPICLSCLRFSTTILCVGCTPETIECWSHFSTSFASSDCCMLYANGSHFLGIHSLVCCAVASQGIASKDLVQIQKCTGAQVPFRKWCDVCMWLTQSSYVLLHILKHFSWCILIVGSDRLYKHSFFQVYHECQPSLPLLSSLPFLFLFLVPYQSPSRISFVIYRNKHRKTQMYMSVNMVLINLYKNQVLQMRGIHDICLFESDLFHLT